MYERILVIMDGTVVSRSYCRRPALLCKFMGVIITFAILIPLLLSGCAQQNIEELFRIPLPSDKYTDLQKNIDTILAGGASYCSPSAGTYRQSVLLYDLSGDGENEAIAIFSAPGEKPLKIYIFKINQGKYETAALIEGDGTGIESISFNDMDADGWNEIVVGWKMEDLQMLNVYSIKGYQPAIIATADYMAYNVFDIDSNGRDELLVIRHNSTTFTGEAEVYRISWDGNTEHFSVDLSPGIKTVSKIAAGFLNDSKCALFVEGNFRGTGVITDIITFDGKQILNITAVTATGISGTYRNYSTLCRDINEDGIIEIPITRTLPSKTDTVYLIYDWYSYNSRGERKLEMSTFHNSSDGWYLVLPTEWGSRITVRRDDSTVGERAVIFSMWNGEDADPEDFLVIYSLTGENRQDRAQRDGRFIVRRESDAIYAAKILSTDWKYAPDKQYVLDNFFIIYSEWYTGQLKS